MFKRIILLFTVIMLVVQAETALAQMVGSPVSNPGTSQWTVSAMGGYLHQGVGSKESVQSYRTLAKSSWGVTPWLDLFIMGGVANIKIELDDQNITPLEDKMRLCYGLGFNTTWSLPFSSTLKLWGGAHAIRYEPRGSFLEDLLIDSQVRTWRTSMEYDWRELKIYAGFSLPVGPVKFYLGGAGWWLQRKETMSEYLEQGEFSSFQGTVKHGDFRSGLWTAGVIGIELSLPENFAIAIEGLLFNTSNMQIYISLLQTGTSGWKPLD
ncbi:hypothetical protein KAR48_03960 [bacterium]|nr:hypothetical protein [bacterium]